MSGSRILAVASEMFPLIKTGGLADVVGALPKALGALGLEVRTLVPGYPAVLGKLGQARRVAGLDDLFGGRGELLTADLDGAQVLVLEAPHLYDRPGGPYQAPGGQDWPDNARRFAALAWAASEIGQGRLGDWRPDIVHAHDWQAGLAPAYLALSGSPHPPTILTIHNIAFQGQFGAYLLPELRLPPRAWAVDGVEYYGGIGFLKGGLQYADAITTVSPTYAREIQREPLGFGLHGLLAARRAALHGIANGIDLAAWDPSTDRLIAQRYDADRLTAKAFNKEALQERLGLPREPRAPLLGMVSRLTRQKGIDLVVEVAREIVGLPAQLVVLGAGERDLEAQLEELARANAQRIAVRIGYDEPLAHLIEAGADAFLMPSRFEPCGLNQMYSLRYGTPPIARATGGLADTIVDATPQSIADGTATGFHFAEESPLALLAAVERAAELYRDAKAWRQIQRAGMAADFGWGAAAQRYAALYADLVRPGDADD